MDFNFDLINIFILLVVVSNSILGIFVFLSKKENIINQRFFTFSVTATTWGLTMFLFRSFPETIVEGLFARILYASASSIPLVFLYFISVFPSGEIFIPKKILQMLSIPFLIIFSLSVLPDYLILGSYKTIGLEPVIIFDKFFHTFYALYITTYFSICYFVLFYKYFKSKGIEKIQLAYVVVGTLIATMIGVTTNLVMPYFGDFALNWMGQIGVISMVGAIAYSIMKHKLFDMKVLATQFTVIILCISLFTKVLFSVDLNDYIINNIFLVITMIVGVFLIRSVLKEVKLREELDKSNTKLKEANLGQVNLIHFMNHQVKGRFGNAKNIFAELLTDDYGVMPDQAKPLLQKGLEETTMGVDYVQNILRGASAENGTLPYDMKPLDYRKIMEESFEREKSRAEEKGLKINLKIDDGEYTMSGDARQLGEATRNLIDNSINYTIEGSIDISLSNDRYAVHLTIKDTGVGISQEDKENLFKSGGRGSDSLKININSTGYGLAFVKGVVDAHKGRVWAESEGKGKGSTFYMELPKS